jgi:hypothetical protein
MSEIRSHFRNVHFFDEANPDAVLGGLIQNGSLTEKNFLVMLDIVLVTTAPIRVSAKDSRRFVSMVDTCLEPGDYLVSCELVGRLLCILARDTHLSSKTTSETPKRPCYAQKFPVVSFLQALFSEKTSALILDKPAELGFIPEIDELSQEEVADHVDVSFCDTYHRRMTLMRVICRPKKRPPYARLSPTPG